MIRAKRPVAFTLLVASAVLFLAGCSLGGSQQSLYRTVLVQRGEVRSTVSATGPLTSITTLSLNFKGSGKIDTIYVRVGDRVHKGDKLAVQDSTDLEAQVAQNQASLANAQAALAKVLAGASPEQVGVAQAQINSAVAGVGAAQNSLAAAQEGAIQDVAVAQQSVNSAASALNGAQMALADAQKNLAVALASQQVAIRNAQLSLADALKSLAQARAAQQTAVQNAQNAVADAQTNLARVRSVVAAQIEVARLAYEQAGNTLYAQQINRDGVCSGTGKPQGPQTVYLIFQCNQANAQVLAAITAQQQALAGYRQAQAQGAQQIASAQQQLDSALATLRSTQNSASVLSAQAQVDTARNALRTAQTDQQVVTARTQVDTAQTQVDSARNQFLTAQVQVGSAIARANTSVASAQGQVSTASGQLGNAQAGYASTAASPRQPDIDAAKAQASVARAQLQLAENNLAGATIFAPIDGTVDQVNGYVGQNVVGGPQNGIPTVSSTTNTSQLPGLIILTDLKALQVTAQVNEADIGGVHSFEPADFTVSAFPSRTFHGTVTAVEPVGQTIANVVDYNVTTTVDNNTQGVQLLPGMTANISIVTGDDKDVLVVPTTALDFARSEISRNPKLLQTSTSTTVVGDVGGVPSYVLTLDATGKEKAVLISTKLSNSQNTEVTGGLGENAKVIVGLNTGQ